MDTQKGALQLACARYMIQALEHRICAAERFPQYEVAHVGYGEVDTWGVFARVSNHLLRCVDARHLKATLACHSRKLAGAAANVQDWRSGRQRREQQPVDDRIRLSMVVGSPVSVVNVREGIVFLVALDH